MATPEGSESPPGTSAGSGPPPEAGSSKIFTSPHQGEAVTTAGVHVPVLHIVGSLPAPVAHRWELTVLCYHKILVMYPYPFFVVITLLFSNIIFINDCICILTGPPG